MRSTLIALFTTSVLLGGCARQPNVSSELPLRRVVVYRNGVGYFERAGHVKGDRVTFKMRGRMVGDFLATLAIVEKGGSSVRSASFPLNIEKAEPEGVEPPEQHQSMLKPWPPPTTPAENGQAMREVILHLDGKQHELSIGYIAETPVWRPSYRLVVRDGGKADLQTWGIVQNVSGEDWTDVELVLVAGAPIAFESTLGEPIIPTRPVVTDSGEVIMAVPAGVTSLADQPEPETEDAESDGDLDAREEAAAAPATKADRRQKSQEMPEPAARAAAPPPPAVPPQQTATLSQPRRLEALAAVAVEGGTTRYELPNRVTVPDESATMVLLLNQSVPGAAVFLFSPDPGVPDSSAHPFRVAQFQNSTSGLLERGPIAIFERGAFLGEGVLESLPPKATATVPFALERSLAVDRRMRHDVLGARLQKITSGELWVERDQVLQSIYRVKNGGKDPGKVLLKHLRMPETRLHQAPAGTEDAVGKGHALVPLEVRGYATQEVLVDERSAQLMKVDWLSEVADLAIRDYLNQPKTDAAAAAQLTEAWKLRGDLRSKVDRRDTLRKQQAELEKAARETRLSLQAIEKNQQAHDLRQKLTARLKDVGQRLDGVTKELVEGEMTIGELEVRFRDSLREVRLVVPPMARVRR